MSIFVESFLANGGKAIFMESLEQEVLKDKNLLFFGGFIEDFVCALQQKGVDLKSLRLSQNRMFLLHPLNFNPYSNLSHFLYEVGCEEAVVALLVNALCPLCSQDSRLQSFIQSLDIGNLASECNLSEEELEEITQSFSKRKSLIILGKDLNTHQRAKNIGGILALLSQSLQEIEIVFLDSTPKEVEICQAQKIESIEDLESYDGLVVYLQYKSLMEPVLEVSEQFSQASKTQKDIRIKVQFSQSEIEIEAKLQNNRELKGMVGILWIPKTFPAKKDCWDKMMDFAIKKLN